MAEITYVDSYNGMPLWADRADKDENGDRILTTYAKISDVPSVDGKADKVSGATGGDLASLDANGNLVDSGIAAGDVVVDSDLSTVATTGSYDDLLDKPVIPAAQVQSDYAQANSAAVDYIKNKPDLSIYAQSANLATVATTGSYDDLLDKPDIPSQQVQSDWTEDDTTDPAYIQHKPTEKELVAGSNITISEGLSTVIISATAEPQVQANWTESDNTEPSYIQNKPVLAAVATSGSYNDLLNKPVIPAAQVQANYAQSNSAAVDYIKNKPDLSIYAQSANLATVATTGDYSDLSNTPDLSVYAESANLATVATTGDYTDLSNTPDLSVYAESANLATVATSGSYNDLLNKPSIPAAQVQADYAQSNSAAVDYIKNKPDLSVYAQSSSLATVATTGDYTDLSNRPSIPAAQVQSDYAQSDSSSVDYIKNKPDLSVYAQSANLATVATTGDYTDLSNTPSLATVATTGDYADLSNKPSIPAAQVNADWDAQSGVASILNKPNLATVATTGSYSDLLNKPAIPPAVTVDQHYDALSANPQSGAAVAEAIAGTGQVPTVTSADDNKVLMASYSGGVGSFSWEPSAAATQVNADWDANSGVAKILNKPDLSVYAQSANLATVATSGSYNDLSNRPSIPAAQVNADWDAASGVAQILNKPTLATVATTGSYSDLSNKPVIPAAQVQSDWTESNSTSKAYIQNKPDLSVYAQSANLATVATTGDYADLQNKPSIPAAQVQSNWNESDNTSKAYIQNKPDLSVYAQSSSLATVATTGSYDDLIDKPSIPAAQIQADWNESDTTSKAYIQNKPTIPAAVTVDQTYNASSANPQSGVAVAGALATVNQVPASTSADEDKVLTVDSNGDAVWATAQGGGSSYTAGAGIDITSGVISADIDDVTIKQATTKSRLQIENNIIRSPSGGYGVIRLNSDVTSKLSMDPDYISQRITIHIPGNTFRRISSGDVTSYFNIYLEITDQTFEFGSDSHASLYPTPLETVYNSTDNYTYIAEQDVVVGCCMRDWVNRGNLDPHSGGTYYIGFAESQTTQVSSQLYVTADGEDWILDGVEITETVATNQIAVAVPVPSPTVSDTGKALIAGANGPEWSQVDYADVANKPDLSVYAQSSNLATVATSGSYSDLSNKPTIPTVSNYYSSLSTNAMSGIAVASAVSGKQNTLTDVSDIVLVNALPASPVSGTLYLIPET